MLYVGYDPNMDYDAEIKAARRDSKEDVQDLVRQRGLKIKDNPTLAIYQPSQDAYEKEFLSVVPNSESTIVETKINNEYSDYISNNTDVITLTERQWLNKVNKIVRSPHDRANGWVIMMTPFGPTPVKEAYVCNFKGKKGYKVICTDTTEALKLSNVGSSICDETFVKYGGKLDKFGHAIYKNQY